MRTPLAWANLAHQKTRTLVAVAGIAFAMVLIFMQLGFRAAMEATATMIYDQIDFDVLIVSRKYQNFTRPGGFSQRRLFLAAGVPGVERVQPLYLGVNFWRAPEEPEERVRRAAGPGEEKKNRERHGLMVMGFDLAEPIFRLDAVNKARERLREPDTVLFDLRSQPEFGRRDEDVVTELGSRKVRIVGQFMLGTGFGADGLVLTSEQTFLRVFPNRLPDEVNFGLVKVAGGADAGQVANDLNRRLPPDVYALPRAERENLEQAYWVAGTSAGRIFTLGVVVALVVGVVFVYQVISSDIAVRLGEFATLKAMGYRHGFLSAVVLKQAWTMAVLAFPPAVAVSWVLYATARGVKGIPIGMTPVRAAVVLALALGMCSLSALLALRKVRTADPADLF